MVQQDEDWLKDCWPEALTVERQYGDGAVRHVSGRIMAREEVGDLWGAARWRDIRFRLEALDRAATIKRV